MNDQGVNITGELLTTPTPDRVLAPARCYPAQLFKFLSTQVELIQYTADGGVATFRPTGLYRASVCE